MSGIWIVIFLILLLSLSCGAGVYDHEDDRYVGGTSPLRFL